MKIKYCEWTCVGCGNIQRFTGKNVLSSTPYWFTIRTERCRSSSHQPSFDTCVCSTRCLENAGVLIEEYIKHRTYTIPNKKEIEVTICNQCGKVNKVDTLNMVIGPDPLAEWIREKTSAGRKDFCCSECNKNHIIHPEESIFVDLKFENFWDVQHLIEVIDSPNLKEAIKPPKSIFFDNSSIREEIKKINDNSKNL